MRTSTLLLATLILQACASPPAAPLPSPVLASAPWSGAALDRTSVPPVYLSQGSKAENRATCGLFAFANPGKAAGAVPRAAAFSGGWAVAYDLPQQRSAFGIAGTGTKASDPTYAGWPNHIEWSDGSRADYGLEGGTGPNHLAYLRIAREGCLYNVWSRISLQHLEELLGAIRRVK